LSNRYELKTGQINFESVQNRGGYACVVIKDGEFHNLNDELRQMLIDKLQQPTKPVRAETTDIEDMF
jgi:hypothetical protein